MPGETAAATQTRLAFEWLDIPPDATAATVREAVCRKLAAANFMPDPTTHEAILIAMGRPIPALGSLLAATADDEICCAVEAFAVDFFAIPVAERLVRWEALWVAAAHLPQVAARLDRLRPGLTIDPQAITAADPSVEWLANDLMNLFVAPVAYRPAWLRGMLARLETKPRVWNRERARASRSIRRVAPALADSGRDYLKRMRPSRALFYLIALIVGLYLCGFAMSRWFPAVARPGPVAPR